MFILYAIPIGLALGFALGGRPAGLARLEFRWPWLVLAGLFIQGILFTDFVAARIGGAGALIYVGSTPAGFGGVLCNVPIPGLPPVGPRAPSQPSATLANGGARPPGG